MYLGLQKIFPCVIDMSKEIHDVNPIQQQPELLRCVVAYPTIYIAEGLEVDIHVAIYQTSNSISVLIIETSWLDGSFSILFLDSERHNYHNSKPPPLKLKDSSSVQVITQF